MNDCDEYIAPNGERISTWRDGPNYVVSCDTDTENRWYRTYRNPEDAKKEFERWRK